MFLTFGKWLQETISYINVRIAISKNHYTWKLLINISIILFYRSIKAIVILGIFSLFFLFVIIPFFFRWCSTLQRHMVFLPYGKIIRYICLQNCLLSHFDAKKIKKLYWLDISHFSSLAKTYQFFRSWERRLIRNNQFLSRNISKSKSWCMAYTSEISRDRKWGQG